MLAYPEPSTLTDSPSHPLSVAHPFITLQYVPAGSPVYTFLLIPWLVMAKNPLFPLRQCAY